MLKEPLQYRDNHRIMKMHYKDHSIEKTNPSRRSLHAMRIPALRPQAATTPASSHQIIFSFVLFLLYVCRYSFFLYPQLFSHWVFAWKRFLTRSATFVHLPLSGSLPLSVLSATPYCVPTSVAIVLLSANAAILCTGKFCHEPC